MEKTDILIAQELFRGGEWCEQVYENARVRELTLCVPLRCAGFVVARYFEQKPSWALAEPLRGVELRLRGAHVKEGIWDYSTLDARVIGAGGGLGNVSRRVYSFDSDGKLTVPQLHDPRSLQAYRQSLHLHFLNQMAMVEHLLLRYEAVS